MKICNICLKEKDDSEFYKHSQTKDKLNSRCKECTKEQANKWQINNREKSREHKNNWVLNNPEKIKNNWKKQNLIHREDHKKWYFNIYRPKLVEQGKIINEVSLGEKLIKEFLTINKINFKQEYTFKDCKSERGYLLFFDFYLSNLNICIEFDGRQHFNLKGFNQSEENFLNIQLNDKIKTEFCLKNQIKLIRINYKEIKSINIILNKEIKNES
jgi:very-short-patch-repair endonuclease